MDEHELRAMLQEVHADAHAWAVACCTNHPDDAEEVLQTVYLSVLDGRARFDGRSSFKTWLFGVIRLTEASMRRRAWVRDLLLAREAGRVRPVEADAVDVEMDRAERADLLRGALVSLAERQREVLELVFYHELTVEDAASIMGIGVGSARTHYARGKARLATLLSGLKES